MADPPQLTLTLGRRILALRETRKLSLRTLAHKADLSASFLSQVERDETSPSLASLERLAQALDVDVASLFLRTQPDPLLRASERSASQQEGVRVERLSRRHLAIHPHRVLLAPGEHLSALPSRSEVFFYLVAGELTVTFGEHERPLAAGDSLHVVRQEHLLTLRNLGADEAEVLTINYL